MRRRRRGKSRGVLEEMVGHGCEVSLTLPGWITKRQREGSG